MSLLGWAAQRLKLETVPSIVVDDDDLHAELAMIDENLMRSELSAAERAAQTARRKAIYEELHPETKAESNASLARKTSDNLSFVTSTASATGKDRRTVERDAERGEALGDDLDAGRFVILEGNRQRRERRARR